MFHLWVCFCTTPEVGADSTVIGVKSAQKGSGGLNGLNIQVSECRNIWGSRVKGQGSRVKGMWGFNLHPDSLASPSSRDSGKSA
jgi:hypothetical protein